MNEEKALEKAKKKRKKAKSKKTKLETFVKNALEQSKHLVEAVPAEKRREMPKEFENYEFTGSLRPCFVTEQLKVASSIAQPDYANDPEGIPLSEVEERRSGSRVIHVYNEEEIEKMRENCSIARDVLDTGGKAVKVGVTGDEIDRIVQRLSLIHI